MAKKKAASKSPSKAAKKGAKTSATLSVKQWTGFHQSETTVASAASAAASKTDKSLLPDYLTEFLEAKDELLGRLLSFSDQVGAASMAAASTKAINAPPGRIRGIGVGAKISDGRYTGDIAVKVFVNTKLPKGQLSPTEQIPKEIGGIRTDVEEQGQAHAAFNEFQSRPVPSGSTIGVENLNDGGTLGAVVAFTSGGTSLLGILSNNHVIANTNQAPLQSLIVQPAGIGGLQNAIATLHAYIPLQTNGNTADAALGFSASAKVRPEMVNGVRLYNGNDGGGMFLQAQPFMKVAKYGANTGFTLGMVDSVGVTVKVGYGDGVERSFNNQILIVGQNGMFGDQGDSGSLVVEASSRVPVGLYFADSDVAADGGVRSWANPIQPIINAFGITRFIHSSSQLGLSASLSTTLAAAAKVKARRPAKVGAKKN